MELNFKQYSDQGKPLLLLHGLFGNLKNWNWHARELASDFAVYALDLRNHGESPHADAMNYEVMAGDVMEFIVANNLADVNILGHSMGGKVAMRLALEFPDKVSRLLVADIAPVTYDSLRGDHENVFEGLLSVNLAEIRSRADAEAGLEAFIDELAVRQFLVSSLTKDEHGSYKWRFNLLALKESYECLRAGIDGDWTFDKPVLFVKGANSNYIKKEDWSTIERLFPQARIKNVLGAGHWLHAEKPQVFQKLASDFFALQEVRS